MNYVDKIRKEMQDLYRPKSYIADSRKIIFSPNRLYRAETSVFGRMDCNIGMTKVEIFEEKTSNLLFSFFVNEETFFHSWVLKDKIDYLLCSEDLCGGQTVLDLTNRKMSSYSTEEDGFIWTDFHLSPDEKTLATIGCYWACPNEIKLYDFSDPMNLPLKEIKELEISNSETIKGWIDNETLLICSWRSESVRYQSEDGTFKYKLEIIETDPERKININSD